MGNSLLFTPSAIGVDETGRGSIAGPLVVCACLLSQPIDNLRDSKQLSASKRLHLAELIIEHSNLELSIISSMNIDRYGIFPSVLKAMFQATDRLIHQTKPDQILIDGTHVPKELPSFARAVIRGDQKFQCIASASVVAKVVRDHIMKGYARLYPGYGFENHKGYATTVHYRALARLNPCPIHRRSFRLC